MLPYSRHDIGADEIAAVVEVLQSEWLTTGPKVAQFEQALASRVGVRHAVAVSSGTAALHAAMHGLGIVEGDEVIVPAMTFAATANSVVYQRGTPVFADVDPETLLIDPVSVERLITPKTRAVIAVDYAGQPCDYDLLRRLLVPHGIPLVADACHSLGATFDGREVGTLADVSAFSFHPVKPITTGEGGMLTTDDDDLAAKMRAFRNHGITSDHRERQKEGTWFYEMVDLGFNYRITDLQCALGIVQLRRLDEFVARRREIAAEYDAAFAPMHHVTPLAVDQRVQHAFHLYVVQLGQQESLDRSAVFNHLRAAGIGVNVHYIPVHLHPFYRDRFGTGPGLCPRSEEAYRRILSLPIHFRMNSQDVKDVIAAVREAAMSSERRAA